MATSGNHPTLDVEQFTTLLALLERVRTEQHTEDDLRPLEIALDNCMPWLESLLDLDGPKPEYRADMEKGKGSVYGPERFDQIIALSDYLHLSEFLCASLLESATEYGPRISREAFPSAIILYHRFRQDLLKTILCIWEAGYLLPEDAATRIIRACCDQWEDAVLGNTESSNSTSNITEKLLRLMGKLQGEMDETIPTPKRLPIVPSLPEAVKIDQVKALRREQRMVMRILHMRAVTESMGFDEALYLVNWLKSRGSADSVTRMAYATYIAVLFPEGTTAGRGKAATERAILILQDPLQVQFLQAIHGQVLASDQWQSQDLSKMVQWQWCILFHTLAQAAERLERDRRERERVDRSKSDFGKTWDILLDRKLVDSMTERVIDSGVFEILGAYLAAFPTLKRGEFHWVSSENESMPSDMCDEWPYVEGEFVYEALTEVDRSIHWAITVNHPIKKMKDREEDQEDAARTLEEVQAVPQHFAALAALVIELYQRRMPDLDQQLWTDARFVSLVADYAARQDDRALIYNLLYVISQGPEGARLLHDALAKRHVKDSSYAELFDVLREASRQTPLLTVTQAAHYQITQLQLKAPPTSQLQDLREEESDTVMAACRLLTTIVEHYPHLAGAILTDLREQQNDILFFLMALVNRKLPAPTLAAVIDLITAFGRSIGQSANYDAARRILLELGRLEVRTAKARSTPSLGVIFNRPGGWLKALEDTDTDNGGSLACTALVNLFACILAAQEDWTMSAMKSGTAYISGSRNPVTSDILSYVLEDVVLRARTLAQTAGGFSATADLSTAIFDLMRLLLAKYDLQSLSEWCSPQQPNIGRIGLGHLANAVEQPGAEVLRCLLGDTEAYTSVMSAAQLGQSGLQLARGIRAAQMVESSLRLVNSVLRKQHAFIVDLQENFARSDLPPTVVSFAARTNVHSLDHRLSVQPDRVVAIATYPALEGHDCIAYLAIQILRMLGTSAHFGSAYVAGGIQTRGNRLAHFIFSSTESWVIRAGFIGRIEAVPLVPSTPHDIVGTTNRLLAGDTWRELDSLPLEWLIHSSILDLLLEQTSAIDSGPTFAHYLLGYYAEGDRFSSRLAGPRESMAPRTCFHSMISQLTEGLSRADVVDDLEDEPPYFVETDPFLAHKTLLVVYQLASQPATSTTTLKYLRSNEDYVYRLLRYMRPQPAEGRPSDGTYGELRYTDGLEMRTTADTLVSSMRYHSVALELAALELHTVRANSKDATHIVKAFLEESSITDVDNDHVRPAAQDQSVSLAMECLLRCRLSWQDVREVNLQPRFFVEIDWAAYRVTGADGLVVFDIPGLRRAMSLEEERLRVTTKIRQEDNAQIQFERDRILQSLAAKNDAIHIAASSAGLLSGWAQLLDVILQKAFDIVPADNRQTVLFDLLRGSCRWLLTGGEGSVIFERTLCQEVLSLVSTLVEVVISQSVASSGPPVKQLVELLQDIVTATSGQVDELARGYLHVSMIKLVDLAVEAQSTDLGLTDGPEASSTLALEMTSLINHQRHKIISDVCRDAFGGFEVWKTVSYTLLNSLVHLTRSTRDQKLVSQLLSDGFVLNLVRTIPVSDLELRDALQVDPEGLDPIYALEAKFSLLQAIAQSQLGADKLVSEGLFEILGRCTFIGARPDGAEAVADAGAYVPCPLERYFQVLLPVLRLSASVMVHGDSNASKRALSGFLSAHREVFLMFLRERPTHLFIGSIEVLQLLVVMVHRIQVNLSDADKYSSDGFRGFQAAVETLGAKFLTDQWQQLIRPLTVEETQAFNGVAVNGKADGDAFVRLATSAVSSLREWLLLYFVVTTKPDKNGAIDPVFACGSESSSKWRQKGAVSLPLLSQAGDLLAEQVDILLASFYDFEDMSMKLSDDRHLSAAEIDEIIATEVPDDAPTLSPGAKRTIAQKAIKRRGEEAKLDLVDGLNSVEKILVLMDRHLRFYRSQRDAKGYGYGYITTTQSQQRTAEQNDCDDVVQALSPTLDQLQEIDFAAVLYEKGDGMQRMLHGLVKRIAGGPA